MDNKRKAHSYGALAADDGRAAKRQKVPPVSCVPVFDFCIAMRAPRRRENGDLRRSRRAGHARPVDLRRRGHDIHQAAPPLFSPLTSSVPDAPSAAAAPESPFEPSRRRPRKLFANRPRPRSTNNSTSSRARAPSPPPSMASTSSTRSAARATRGELSSSSRPCFPHRGAASRD